MATHRLVTTSLDIFDHLYGKTVRLLRWRCVWCHDAWIVPPNPDDECVS